MRIIIIIVIMINDNDDDSVHGPHGQNRGHRKLTRQRREIFPDYERRVQERVLGEAEDEDEENCDSSNLETVIYILSDRMTGLIWYSA